MHRRNTLPPLAAGAAVALLFVIDRASLAIPTAGRRATVAPHADRPHAEQPAVRQPAEPPRATHASALVLAHGTPAAVPPNAVPPADSTPAPTRPAQGQLDLRLSIAPGMSPTQLRAFLAGSTSTLVYIHTRAGGREVERFEVFDPADGRLVAHQAARWRQFSDQHPDDRCWWIELQPSAVAGLHTVNTEGTPVLLLDERLTSRLWARHRERHPRRPADHTVALRLDCSNGDATPRMNLQALTSSGASPDQLR